MAKPALFEVRIFATISVEADDDATDDDLIDLAIEQIHEGHCRIKQFHQEALAP